MRITEPIAGIEGVASGADATVKIPTNRRLHQVRLFAQGTNSVPATVYGVDVIDTVFQYVGTRLIRIITGAELLFLSAFNGITRTQSTDGLAIYYSDPKRASVMDEQVTAWDLFGVSEMTLKVRLKSGLTGVTLAAEMDYDDGFSTNAAGARVLNIVKQEPTFVSAASIQDLTQIVADYPIQRIYLAPDAGVSINSVKVVVNDTQTVLETTAARNKAKLAEYGLVAPTPGNGAIFPIAFDANGQLFDGLPAVKSLRITVTSSASGQLKALVEKRVPGYI